MMLYELIGWLEKQDPEMVVRDGFGTPHSDRGDYEDLAFSPVDKSTIQEMLHFAKSAVGKTFEGYKGGEYEMTECSQVKIGRPYESGEEITTVHFKYWELTGCFGSGIRI